jgi:NADH dehydrogenase [ubiquinone] 1 alpha subcomplex assembly factor 1
MNLFLFFTILFTSMQAQVIFDFNKKSDLQDWIIVNDVVMGGRSSSTFKLNENNGGFSSLRYRFVKRTLKEYTHVKITLCGDGKKYQFRVKSNARDYYSYIAPFLTSGEWQEIVIPLEDMYPSFRGRRLNQPNFSNDSIEELTFLIGNKKSEKFKLLIDKIVLE